MGFQLTLIQIAAFRNKKVIFNCIFLFVYCTCQVGFIFHLFIHFSRILLRIYSTSQLIAFLETSKILQHIFKEQVEADAKNSLAKKRCSQENQSLLFYVNSNTGTLCTLYNTLAVLFRLLLPCLNKAFLINT